MTQSKEDIRSRVRACKSMLGEAERIAAASRVFDRVRSMAAFMMAHRVLLYHSLPDELSTREFIDSFADDPDKQFFLPRVNGLDLEILPYERSRMHLGAFRIEEPDGDETVDISDIDLVIVPAVAYDRRGNRVGRGKGYYDRLLSRSKAVTIGVCYDFQLFDEIETEEHDIPVHFVVADGHDIYRGRRR
ncbi:MAG: 5-formyltetrahydrofolate cyclo-ligase [Muribaculaceae bacterium]|nr:5-formyltetrahydrofolate cyclo-ligase [Muribaculaceae bacterium]